MQKYTPGTGLTLHIVLCQVCAVTLKSTIKTPLVTIILISIIQSMQGFQFQFQNLTREKEEIILNIFHITLGGFMGLHQKFLKAKQRNQSNTKAAATLPLQLVLFFYKCVTIIHLLVIINTKPENTFIIFVIRCPLIQSFILYIYIGLAQCVSDLKNLDNFFFNYALEPAQAFIYLYVSGICAPTRISALD